MTVELRKLSSGPADRPSLGPTPEGPGGKVKTELEPRVSKDPGRGQRPGPGASIAGTACPFPKDAAQGGDAPARSRLQPWAAVRRRAGGGAGKQGSAGPAWGTGRCFVRDSSGGGTAGGRRLVDFGAPGPAVAPGGGGWGDSGAPRTLGRPRVPGRIAIPVRGLRAAGLRGDPERAMGECGRRGGGFARRRVGAQAARQQDRAGFASQAATGGHGQL